MPDVLARLSAALADHYALERELGQGGMATVYLAEDLKHHRKVALKVLRPELAATLGVERFLREVTIAANLQHPNILPVHDSGEAAGFLYYVMPFVEGHSLRERLAKEGELPVPEAARILRDVADALSAAHEKGVVHRDIKPENVLLTGRHALVADFGVAKAVSEATGRQTLTTAGLALGTPTYMAPEQAAASPHIDHRADLYAFGVMAYEMLTGQPPFTAATPQALLSAHVTEPPLEVTQRRATIPAPLAQLIMRCLAKKAADRPQTADEMLPILESFTTPSGGITPTDTRPVPAVLLRRPMIPIALVAIVALALGGYALWHSRTSAGPAADVREPVLVLPYEEHVTSPGLRGIGQQVADRFEAAITQATLGAVLQRRTVAALGAATVTPDVVRSVARTSGAATLVTGVVYERGDSIEVQSQVLRARDLRTLFSLTPERGVARDVERVIEAAKGRVLGAVGIYLWPVARGAIDVTQYGPPASLQALRLYERGTQLFMQGDFAASIAVLAEGFRRDSGLFAAALRIQGGLRNLGRYREADSVLRFVEVRRARLTAGENLLLNVERSWRLSPEEEYRATTDAVRQDSGQFWIYLAMTGANKANHQSEALRYYRRRDSTLVMSRAWQPWFTVAAGAMHALGRYADELVLAREAKARQPDYYDHTVVEARALIGLGRLAEVEALLTGSRALPTARAPGRLMHDVALELNAHGLRDDARRMWSRALAWHTAQPSGSAEERMIRQYIAFEHYLLGQYDEARQAFAGLLAQSPDNRFYRTGAAFVAARTGDSALALRTAAELRADTSVNDNYAARILALLGRNEEAVAAFRQYLNRGGRFYLGSWHTVPEFDGLRDYPPFVALVALKE